MMISRRGVDGLPAVAATRPIRFMLTERAGGGEGGGDVTPVARLPADPLVFLWPQGRAVTPW